MACFSSAQTQTQTPANTRARAQKCPRTMTMGRPGLMPPTKWRQRLGGGRSRVPLPTRPRGEQRVGLSHNSRVYPSVPLPPPPPPHLPLTLSDDASTFCQPELLYLGSPISSPWHWKKRKAHHQSSRPGKRQLVRTPAGCARHGSGRLGRGRQSGAVGVRRARARRVAGELAHAPSEAREAAACPRDRTASRKFARAPLVR